jgi:hypothetical protein
MIELKTLSRKSIPAALEMARHYRLIGEPDEAESICQDILAVDRDNQDALITLILSLTDRFSGNNMVDAFEKARETVDRLSDQYCKSYYTGIVFERRAKHHFNSGSPGSGRVAHGWYVKALYAFNEALASCDPNNQDAVLRWNSCARFINDHPELIPQDDTEPDMLLDAFETPH